MPVRSRSARFAALALAATTPLIASLAAPAFADGSDADVEAGFSEPGYVTVTSSKSLSRVTIVTCDGTTVVADRWGGALTGKVAIDGDVRAVFIHSGDNTTDEAIALLEFLAPGASSGSSTGEIAFNESCDDESGDDGSDDDGSEDGSDDDGSDDDGSDDDGSDDDGSDDDGSDDDGDDTVSPTDTNDPGPGTNDPAPVTTAAPTEVLGVTIDKAGNPAPAPTSSPVIDSTTLSAGGELPRTGSSVQFLMTLALSLVAAGVALRAAFGRRIRSASSPG